ncbi:MAG: ATP-binding protein [Hydrococcus sp. Prado102]|nr:ATP-binding protein [Hydrococcus sp. Prado102]
MAIDLETLRKIPLFSHLPEDQLQCLSEQGNEIRLSAGTQIAKQGDPPDGFYVILDGKTEWTRKVGQQEAHAVTLVAGDVFAELILLLDEPYPTSGRALTDVHLYKLTSEEFWEMLQMCPTILRRILKISAERSQIHESVSQQQAKLISLGTLSAGLAHELNNPAAAMRRNVETLEEVLQKLPSLALKMHQQPISEGQLTFLCDFYARSLETAKNTDKLDPLTQSELEDEITDWLEDRDVKEAWKLSPVLASAGLGTDTLDELAQQVDGNCIGSILTWLEATLTGTCLLEEIQQSSQRIYELIKSMKEYSYMDRAPMQEVDVHEGIISTLTILKHKLKYGITVTKKFGNLPPICAYGRELNQVWTNLIDNAIDAMNGKGNLKIRTALEGDRVLVEIADNGGGIPPDIQSRIFEQFFTTKEAGKGTGLGLDIARRIIVGQHKGDIRFDSQPGETKFQVRLPIKPIQ